MSHPRSNVDCRPDSFDHRLPDVLLQDACDDSSMTRWVALLRGVNVNGVTVRSADLQAQFALLRFENVRTVLASGNVVFDAADEPLVVLKRRIESGLREAFGYDAWIVLLEVSRLQRICADYPFERRDADRHPYVVFSSDDNVLEELAARTPVSAGKSADTGDERIQAAEGVLYWEVPLGSSTNTPFARASAAARYKPFLTTRNLRTLEKVLAVADC